MRKDHQDLMRSYVTMPVGALGVERLSQHETPPQPARRSASKERSYFRLQIVQSDIDQNHPRIINLAVFHCKACTLCYNGKCVHEKRLPSSSILMKH